MKLDWFVNRGSKSRINHKKFLVLLGFLSMVPVCLSTETAKKEIEYLIGFVLNSNCTFIRNGKPHTADEAVKHIQRKYNYFRDDINSAEQFIELAASKSALSGRPYYTYCDSQKNKQLSSDWLLIALQKYRSDETD
ncbi:DUF5329 family protein [Microbulbifer spongiae]|uniref:DUF5329 domain-containing protein n=1 Tax=Microbulbifer spongiae TaxID=2944933 RepID=A0ABY9EE51_9GAMM|nr:DUF5329 family protein [Microbulbifer sp. MI-G]WKD49799.1 DUF5329 domain-containing protein [Microbulbifer sp. MI-G]